MQSNRPNAQPTPAANSNQNPSEQKQSNAVEGMSEILKQIAQQQAQGKQDHEIIIKGTSTRHNKTVNDKSTAEPQQSVKQNSKC